jgi:hypothetical protein
VRKWRSIHNIQNTSATSRTNFRRISVSERRKYYNEEGEKENRACTWIFRERIVQHNSLEGYKRALMWNRHRTSYIIFILHKSQETFETHNVLTWLATLWSVNIETAIWQQSAYNRESHRKKCPSLRSPLHGQWMSNSCTFLNGEKCISSEKGKNLKN